MEPAWISKKNLRKEIPPAVVALASEAKLHKCWVHHKASKKWFTPEEFLKEGSHYYHGRRGQDNAAEFAVVDPMVGLKMRLETLKRVSDELAIFQKRLEDYYNIQLRGK